MDTVSKKHPIKLNDSQLQSSNCTVQIAVLLLTLCVFLYMGLLFTMNLTF